MQNNIKKYRKKKQMSQEELAKKCNVTRQTINAIENSKYDPSLRLAVLISQILEVRIDELFIFDWINKTIKRKDENEKNG
ncbi:helix-turn-helix transcriptional regulator [Weizmannia coagulans]|uniref:DNA-binding protein n=3 Tax=Heyndrickxia TaxID=2837504 RepID=A0AAN0T3H8_HEYCO|nr:MULTISPECIES: helix-turn-helix transcriptional regulator [Heyndrickxia]AJO21124.1 DNA-binding protein [Heyndrickxia coagulans]APB37539.1 transcriptional regulator [Heyndrickxia coagulans]ATW81784.1 transcriptional regulator [Heyndrickxia coagulans]KGB29726.1 XRE family transcriptional regulator [Heyndrickxia coagulans]KGT37924.1 XRE family transcriptional regulator [Heyndrickxia coagulans P38]